MQIDAAVPWDGGRAYFFSEKWCVSYDLDKSSPDPGYPREIRDCFAGLTLEGVDAAFNPGKGKAYFFSGMTYWQIDVATRRVDPGFPRPMSSATWTLWPFKGIQKIDAVITRSDGKAYFFAGPLYARFDIPNWLFEPFYPLPISGETWPGLGLKTVGAAISADLRLNKGTPVNEPCFFFDGPQHVLFDLKADKAIWDGENQLVQVWPGQPSFDRNAPRDFLKRTEAFLQTLTDIGASATPEGATRALELIMSARPVIATYMTSITTLLAAADARIADLQRRAGELSVALATLSDNLSRLQSAVDTASAELASAKASSDATQSRTTELQRTVMLAQAQKAVTEARLKELNDYWWVPGYGAYLGIRTLADNDVAVLNSANQDLAANTNALNQKAAEMDAITRSIGQLQGSLAKMRSDQDLFRTQKAGNDHLLLVCKQRTAFMIATRTRLGEVQAVAEDRAGLKLDLLRQALDRLTSERMPVDMSVLNRRSATFANGLRDFALTLDERADFLTYFPPSGNALAIMNSAVATITCRVVRIAGGQRTEFPWRPALMAGQSDVVDLSGYGLKDLDPIYLEMTSGPLNPTAMSQKILYIAQSEQELARFRAFGGFATGVWVSHEM